jgi:HSP20 family molecular chaperone IbpA
LFKVSSLLKKEGGLLIYVIDYVQKGLAFRKFFKQFELAKDVIIDEAEMKDGLLKIKLGYNEPKEIEGVKIDIK